MVNTTCQRSVQKNDVVSKMLLWSNVYLPRGSQVNSFCGDSRGSDPEIIKGGQKMFVDKSQQKFGSLLLLLSFVNKNNRNTTRQS